MTKSITMVQMGATSVSCQLVILYLFGLRPVSPTSSFAMVVSCEVLAALDDNCHGRLALKACLPTERSSSAKNLTAESRKWTLFDITIADAENATSSALKLEYFCDLQSVDWTRTPDLEHTIRDTPSTRSVWKDILCLLAVNYKLPSSRCTFVLGRDRNDVGHKSWSSPEKKGHKCINHGRTAEGTNHDAKDATTLPTECAPSGSNKSDDLAVEDVPRVKTLDYKVKFENKGLISVKCCGDPSGPDKAIHIPGLVLKKSRTVDSQNRVLPPLAQSGRIATTSGLDSDLTLDEIDRLNIPRRGNISEIIIDDLLMAAFKCAYGYFGRLCDHQCHCMNRGDCDKYFGICFVKECALGWMGESCDERQCPAGYYGLGLHQYCTKRCLCGNSSDCDVVTGECRLQMCFNTSVASECAEQLCPRRRLDRNRNCQVECYCLNGAVCHPVTGMCPGEQNNCAPGYLPPNCTVRADEMEWYELSPVRAVVVAFIVLILGAKFYYIFMVRFLPKMI